MSKEKENKLTARRLAFTAMLSALSFVLQFIEIGLPFMPNFIKFDFSDLPALIGAYTYGPISGILIQLIKNLIHCFVSQSATVGELSNFLLGSAFVGIAGLIYTHHKTKRNALLGGICGALAMGIISVPLNFFVVYPFYYNFMSEDAVLNMYQIILPGMENIFQCLLIFNLPFTIVKGLLSVLISMLIYKKISPVLKGRI